VEFILNFFGFVLVHLGSLVVLIATFFVLGRKLTSRIEFASAWEEISISCTLGYGATATILFGLGLIHQLGRSRTLCVLAVLHLVSVDVWRSTIRRLRAVESRPRPRYLVAGSIFVGVLIAPMFLMTLYPPTQFDATLYHLPTAAAFVHAGSLPFLEVLRYPVFPQLQEMLFVLGFFLTGEIAAQMTQHVALLLVSMILIAWGRFFSGGSVGIWSAALWLGNPLAVWLGGAAYVDIGLTLFVTAAFFAWYRWLTTERTSWLALAAAFIGFACASKYLGLFFLGVLAVATSVVSLRRRNIQAILAFAAVVLGIIGPWYARIVYFTGNPVFPYFTNVFGASAWSHHLTSGPAAQSPAHVTYWTHQLFEIYIHLEYLLMVPFNAVFARELFRFQAPISPWYMVLIPLLAYPMLRTRFGRWTTGLVVAYGFFWVATVRDIRFLLPIIPLAGLALASGADFGLARLRVRTSLRPVVESILVVSLVAPGWLYGWFKAGELGLPPTSARDRAGFLSQHVPGHEGIETLNRRFGSDFTVYALFAEDLRYYAEGRFLGDWFGPCSFREITPLLRHPLRLRAELHAIGAQYLLISKKGRRPETASPEVMAPHFSVVADTADAVVFRCHGCE